MTNPHSKVLLLAGGVGSRLRPITDTIPKCLVPICGKPLIDYWFDALEIAGIRDVLINTHHLAGEVRDHLAKVKETDCVRVVETYEPKLLGSAGTIHANRAWADDTDVVLIIYADNLSNVSLTELLQFHRLHDDPMTMMLFHAPVPSACGIAELDNEQHVISFIEKPENPKSDLANAGLYVVNAEAYREIADLEAFDIGFDVLPRFVGRMRGWASDCYHLDVGTHEALAKAREDALTIFDGAETEDDFACGVCGS